MSKAKSELSLFENSGKVPDGFIYQEKFLSQAEEQQLIERLQEFQLAPFRYYQFTGKRRTISFGWQYEFGNKDILPAPDIPAFLMPLRTRAGALFGIDPNSLVHVSIIEYPVGAPIGWHRDIPHFGMVVGISLSAACRMKFREYPPIKSKSRRDKILAIELKARSIYLMSGASRESWQHSIPPVKELRYAIMMRTLRDPSK